VDKATIPTALVPSLQTRELRLLLHSNRSRSRAIRITGGMQSGRTVHQQNHALPPLRDTLPENYAVVRVGVIPGPARPKDVSRSLWYDAIAHQFLSDVAKLTMGNLGVWAIVGRIGVAFSTALGGTRHGRSSQDTLCHSRRDVRMRWETPIRFEIPDGRQCAVTIQLMNSGFRRWRLPDIEVVN
jgi:hypothetical protein